MILMKQIITKSVVGVDQKILKKPEVKGLLCYFLSLFSYQECMISTISYTLDAYLEERVFNAKAIAPR